jgi:poly(hydroxyalkanoate) depolymerase family esterase
MQPLATVLDDVRSGRRPPWPCHPTAPTLKYTNPSFSQQLTEVSAFGSNPGNLRMLKFVPRRLRQGSPLVVVLHGCAQTAHDINQGSGWSALANESGFALLLPEQRLSNNAKRGFNWFKRGDSRRGNGEALSIRQMIERMFEDHAIDRRQVYVTGLSAGGAMTSVLLASYPDTFAGGAIIAGLPFGVASSLWGAVGAMKGAVARSSSSLGEEIRAASPHRGRWPRISIWHGSADKTVAPSNADAILRQWCNVHGLDEDDAIEARIAGQTRGVWRDSSGAALIERFMIPGMGHGMPVDAMANGGYGYGAAVPFVEDVGISSTHHIARFWGLPRRQSRPWG